MKGIGTFIFISAIILLILLLPSQEKPFQGKTYAYVAVPVSSATNNTEMIIENSTFGECNNNPHQYDYLIAPINYSLSDCQNCNEEEHILYGTSMLPTIKNNTLLKIQFGTVNFHIGEILAYNRKMEKSNEIYYNPSQYTTFVHRLVDFQGDDLILKGDNNDFCELIPRSAVYGVVSGAVE